MSAEAPEILLAHYLKSLKLPTFQREYQKLARLCATEGVDHIGYLTRLAEREMIERDRRKVERRIKAAKFPVVKSLDSFDFAAIPKLNKMQVLELARCEWIERRENVIALGLSACQKGACPSASPANPSGFGLWPPEYSQSRRAGCGSAAPRNGCRRSV